MAKKIHVILLSIVLFGGGFGISAMYSEVRTATYQVDYSGKVEAGKRKTKKLFTALSEASPNDTVRIDLTTPGGSVFLLLKILDAIETSKAKVVITVRGYAFSAGFPFAMAADSIKIGPNSLFMVHLARTPKGILPLSDPFQVHTIRVLDRYVSKYLTDDEMVRVLVGEDVFISGQELKKRVHLGEINSKRLRDFIPLLSIKR